MEDSYRLWGSYFVNGQVVKDENVSEIREFR